MEPLNSGPLNSGKHLNNRQGRLDQWIFHYIKTFLVENPSVKDDLALTKKIHC